MKVIFPGPNVVSDAADVGQHYPRMGITLAVGENEVPEDAAKTLLERGHVKPSPSRSVSASSLPSSPLSAEGAAIGEGTAEPRSRRRTGEEK
jgi:hypothetical protein